MATNAEKWCPIKTPKGKILRGYEISDQGRIRSYWKKAGPRPGLMETPRLRKASFSRVNGRKTAWQVVCLRTARGKFWSFLVHELVALAFLGPRPSARHVAVHLNHKFNDNRATNLAWMTKSEASLLAIKHKPRRPLAKLTPRDVLQIRNAPGPASRVALEYGLETKAVYNIWWGKTWKDVGGKVGRRRPIGPKSSRWAEA